MSELESFPGYALITGAVGGIGQSLVKEFTCAGYKVIATDIIESPEDLGCAYYIQADLAKTVEDKIYADEVFSELYSILNGQGLKVLINNAAVQILGNVESLTRQDWQKTLSVNLVAPFIWTQALLKDLERAKGSVINLSSIHAKLTKKNFLAYATSKAALSGMTRAMAVDFGDSVRVNAIEPAAIETEMLLAGFHGDSKAYRNLKKYHPVGRIGLPSEIATMAVFLARSDMMFLSGECFPFDGGISSRLFEPE